MVTETFVIKLKKPTKKKHKQWVLEQKEYASCVNECVSRLSDGEKLSSKNIEANLKSAIKNQAIRRAQKAILEKKKGSAKTMPTFNSSLSIQINNQNWNTIEKNSRWYIAFTTNEKKITMLVVENDQVKTFFPYLTAKNREFRGTIELFRKGKRWYMAIPIQVSSELDIKSKDYSIYTPVGVDLGLRHLAVVSEPTSGKRQFFSGKEVGYKRRHFRSLRRSLRKKKAQRAIEQVGKKESRWMKNYNRKLAKDIVEFAKSFAKPMIKMERLDDIRKTCRALKRTDRTIHSWAFYQLKQFIREYAAKFNISVVDIDPYKTNQTCFKCHHVEKGNR